MSSALVLLLAQMCVWEAGLAVADTRECAAMVQVLEYRGLLHEEGIYAYSTLGRFKDRRWVEGLNAYLEEPEGWPKRLSWARNRPRWARVLRKAERLLSRRWKPKPCPRGTDHWAAKWWNRRGMLDSGRVPADCGRTRNRFWIRKRRQR